MAKKFFTDNSLATLISEMKAYVSSIFTSHKEAVDNSLANKDNWDKAYTHSTSNHARTDATKVEGSTTNGKIKINGSDTTVYSHPNSGVTAGTYKSVTVNAQGHITSGSNPTTLSGHGIVNAYTKEEVDDLVDAKANSTHAHTIAQVTGLQDSLEGLQSSLDGKAAKSHGTHVTYSTTNPVVDGVASAGSASTVARSDHKHPTDTTRAAQSDLTTHINNTTPHVSSSERTKWNNHVSSTHAPTDAEKNQNAFSNISVGTAVIAADTATDTLTFAAGTGISISADTTNDKVTITNSGVRSIGTGGENGTISVNTNGSSANVIVKGLGTAAFTNSSDYDAAGLAESQSANALTTAKKYTDDQIAALINGAPGTLDTLDELAAALKDNPNTVAVLEQAISNKVDKDGSKVLSTYDFTKLYKDKLDGIAASAEVNQNAFSNVVVGSTTIAADSKTDTLTLVAGSNVTLTPDASGDKITIAAKDTTYSLSSFGITATSTELNYCDGVTSSIQAQLNGKAATSHGTHVPTPETANNAKFLRNDNTWQLITPAAIGAAASSHGTHVTYGGNGSATTVSRSDHTHSYLPLSGGTLTGKLTISYATNEVMTSASNNPQIVFAESGSQPVHLIYSDYDAYRSPAGLKVIGGSSATPAWFEVEGALITGGNITSSGTVSAVTLKASSTSAAKHLEFSRGSINYITTPASGSVAFVMNGKDVGTANAPLVVADGSVYPGMTANLGTSSNKWSNVYATTFNGALSGNATSASAVYSAANNPTSEARFYPFMNTSASNANKVAYFNTSISCAIKHGSTSATGYNYLILGNGAASGSDGNYYGVVRYYSTNTGYCDLRYTASTSNVINYLPASNGTLLNTANYSGYALPLSGGTLTGNINYTMHSSTQTPFKVYGGDANGQGISVGAGGATIVGAGESAKWLESHVSATTEELHLSSDGKIVFWSNCQNGSTADAKTVYLDANRYFYPAADNSGSVGTSGNKWASMYATTFYGALSGNASTATKATQDASGNVITSTYATKTEMNKKADAQARYQIAENTGTATYYKLFTINATSTYINANYEVQFTSRTAGVGKLIVYVNSAADKYMTGAIYCGGTTVAQNNFKGFLYKDTTNATSRFEVWMNLGSWDDVRFYEKVVQPRGVTIIWNLTQGSAYPTNATTTVTPTLSTWLGNAATASNASQVSITATNPSSGTTYAIPFINGFTSGSGYAVRVNNGLQYYTKEGTTSAAGTAELGLGNSTATGTAGNKVGKIYLYGTSTGYTYIAPTNNTTNNITINLPSSGGTLALTNHTHSYLPLSGGTLTGDLTAPRIKLSSTSAVRHIQFSRAGLNYVTTPDSASIVFIIGESKSIERASASFAINNASVAPGSTNAINCGTSDYRWASVYSNIGNFSGQVTSTYVGPGAFQVTTSSGTTGFQATRSDITAAGQTTAGVNCRIGISSAGNAGIWVTSAGGLQPIIYRNPTDTSDTTRFQGRIVMANAYGTGNPPSSGTLVNGMIYFKIIS